MEIIFEGKISEIKDVLKLKGNINELIKNHKFEINQKIFKIL